MSVKIFADLMSQPSRATVIFCRAAGIKHELVTTRIAQQEHKTPELIAMNPLQKLPIIQDGSFSLSESVAILRYLAREKSDVVADHWYPQGSKAQARVDEYLEWQHLNTRLFCAEYFVKRWLVPITTRTKPDLDQVADIKVKLNSTLDVIENIWLSKGDKPFLCGDKISVADILAACEMEQPSMAGLTLTDGRPILTAYMARVREELNPHYDEVHKVVYLMKNKFGGDIPGVYTSK